MIMANDQLHRVQGIISTAVAIDKDKNSQLAVKWAVENLLSHDKRIILVHVIVQPNSQDAVPKEGRAPTTSEMHQFFAPYRGFCARKGVRAKEVIIHDNDIASALTEYICANSITNIALGACSRSAITRTFRVDVPSSLGRSAPDFCSVYAISKAKVAKIKSASQYVTPDGTTQSPNHGSLPDAPALSNFTRQESWRAAASETASSDGGNRRSSVEFPQDMYSGSKASSNSPSDSREYTQTPPDDRAFGWKTASPPNSVSNINDFMQSPWERRYGTKNVSPLYSDTSAEIFQNTPSDRQSSMTSSSELSPLNLPNRQPGNKSFPTKQPVNNLNHRAWTKDSLSHGTSEVSELQSFQSSGISFEFLDQPSDSSTSSTSFQAAGELEDELRILKSELRHITERYNAACKEALTARDKVKEMDESMSAEERMLVEAKNGQEFALAMVERERQKCKAAVEVARKAQHIAELESEKRKRAEIKLKREVKEKQKAMDALARSEIRYRKYTIEEIEAATSYFSISQKIGEGGYGPVYKAMLDHTAVAIKVLRPDMSQGHKQFQREVEVLCRLRHPNMVILLGACPEYGSLVYEYMENGSLEDRLYRRNGTPTIPWPARFRIAAEIATALHFLHQTRPEPLVHRDLKPANILLDKNYVSKISDVGLSRLVPPSLADSVAQYHMTAAAGTFCYIDPEYQQTGMLGTQSDIYSFGVMLLQILTAKPAMGLSHHVERAIEKGQFADILDQTVKDWLVEDALSCAKLALKCCELRKRDRPDLDSVILPELERLRDLGSEDKEL